MSYYKNLIVILLVLALVFRIITDNKKWFCITAGTVLALFQGFRDYYTCGIDLIRYFRIYEHLGTQDYLTALSHNEGENSLYYLINAIFSRHQVPFQAFIFLVSVFSVSITIWFIYKHSDYPLLGIALILGMDYYLFQFSGLKQTLSMACALIAMDANMEQKNAKTILWTFFVILFHFAGVVIIPFLLLSRFNITIQRVVVCLLGVLTFLIFRIPIGNALVLLFRDEYVDNYVVTERIGGTAWFLILCIVFFLYCYYETFYEQIFSKEIRSARKKAWVISLNRGKKSKTYYEKRRTIQINEEMKASFYGLIILATIQVCASFSYAFTRLNLYYTPLTAIVFTKILNAEKMQKQFKPYFILKYFIIVVVASYMFYQFFRILPGQNLEQYRFFWEAR